DNEINVYPLTMEDTTSTAILTEVETLLNGDSINPMTDKVKAFSPEKIEKTINLNVILEKDSDLETVEKLVNDACEKYKNEMRGLLNTEIVPSQIIAQVGAIEGVYSADTGNLTNTVANINQYFDITFELTISQKGE
ncbi:baseplate J/gp47 family protein, partial [bacterium]|nr:baseplate J/gp47 family protein [bacterium]